jgi:arylsulfatase A-like enzyme
MNGLVELGIAENTLVVCHADNGPMTHSPPAGMGLAETIFRGGKGDFTEGGVRVPAFAWWPGVIEGGQIVNDIIHETGLFTTLLMVRRSLDEAWSCEADLRHQVEGRGPWAGSTSLGR